MLCLQGDLKTSASQNCSCNQAVMWQGGIQHYSSSYPGELTARSAFNSEVSCADHILPEINILHFAGNTGADSDPENPHVSCS